MSVKKNDVEIKKYKMVAPDGGWGYLICVSFIVIIAPQNMFAGCFGIIFEDFMKEIHMSSTQVTFLSGCSAFCIATAGFFTDSMLKVVSRRKLTMIAVILYITSAIGTVFATNVYQFFLVQAILPGLSMGITFNVCSSIIIDYFDKKRAFAFSLVNFFVALNSMIAPLFVKWTLQEFGYRGTLMLIAGISLHSIIGALLLQPVKWHRKKVEVVPSSETQILLIEEKPIKTPTIQLGDDETKMTKNNFAVVPVESVEKSTLRNTIEMFVDIAFFKKFIISCACIGPAICNFAVITYTIMFPQALYSMGWSQSSVALAISLYGFGDLAMRTVLIFASNFLLRIGSQELYIIGIVIACVSKFGMIWSENVIVIYIFIVIVGVARCFICVLITIVISDVVKPEMFTQAMGIFMIVCGTSTVVVGPIIGAVRDLTDSYSTAFYFLISLFAIITLFWSIELCYKRNKHKRNVPTKLVDKPIRKNKGK